ncbi:MAG: hypothetical protein M3081_18070 [Gemmatimonadota bacterium]|nr:hypothetical protein [Gemmatimonadota bacterium]
MSTAETTAMSFELVLSSEPGANAQNPIHALLRFRVLGSFSVTQASVDTTAGQRMTGHFTGTYSSQAVLESTATSNDSPSLEVEVTLQRSGTAEAGTLKVNFGSETSRIVLLAEGSWGGQPLAATLKLSVGAGVGTNSALVSLAGNSPYAKLIELLTASAIASGDALTEGSALRMLSTSALELIGQGMTRANQGGTAYVDAALHQLFPPAPPPVDDLTVRATLDWVLFHRRRTKRCAAPVEQPPVTPPRRYQLYEYRAESVRELIPIRRALLTPSDITRIPFKRVDVVEFSGGLSTLLTAPDALLRDWSTAQPGNTLIYGAIATIVAADAPLSSPRLTRVAEGVAATSAIDPNQSLFETIPDVPAALAVPGTDGMIFLVTLNVTHTTCHDVYRIELSAPLLRLLDADNLSALLQAPEIRHLASVEFEQGSMTPIAGDGGALAQAWTNTGGGTANSLVVYHNPAVTAAGDAATLQARGQALVSAAGIAANVPVVQRPVAGAWPVGPTCPAISVFVTQTKRTVRAIALHSAVGAAPRIALQHDVITFLSDTLVQDVEFQALLTELHGHLVGFAAVSHVSGVELVLGGASDRADISRLNGMVTALEGSSPTVVLASSLAQPPGIRAATTAERLMLSENGKTVNDLLIVTFFP